MRTRKILAPIVAVGFGVLASAALAVPAQATTVTPPTVKVTDTCELSGNSAVGSRLIHIENGSDEAITVTATGVSPVGARSTEVGARNSADVKAWKSDAFGMSWTSATIVDAQTLPTVPKWVAPSKCVPVVKVTNPTCDDPTLSVSIENPLEAKRSIKVKFDGAASATVIPGDFAAYEGATKSITYTWNASWLGLSQTKSVEYVQPTKCDGDEPGADVIVPAPGKPTHGHGHFIRKRPAAWHGGNGGSQSSSSSSSSSGGASTGGAKGSSGGGNGLPVTGAPAGMVVAIGLVALVGGVLVVAAVRRRRSVRFTA